MNDLTDILTPEELKEAVRVLKLGAEEYEIERLLKLCYEAYNNWPDSLKDKLEKEAAYLRDIIFTNIKNDSMV